MLEILLISESLINFRVSRRWQLPSVQLAIHPKPNTFCLNLDGLMVFGNKIHRLRVMQVVIKWSKFRRRVNRFRRDRRKDFREIMTIRLMNLRRKEMKRLSNLKILDLQYDLNNNFDSIYLIFYFFKLLNSY